MLWSAWFSFSFISFIPRLLDKSYSRCLGKHSNPGDYLNSISDSPCTCAFPVHFVRSWGSVLPDTSHTLDGLDRDPWRLKGLGPEHRTEECRQSFITDFCYVMCPFWSRFDKYIYGKYWGINGHRSCETDPHRRSKGAFSEQYECQWPVQARDWFMFTPFSSGTDFRDLHYTSAQVDHLCVCMSTLDVN